MYRLKSDWQGHKAGTLLFDIKGSDFGASSMDTFMTQIEHVSVTREHDGDYPCFSIPKFHLEELE